MTDRPWLSAYPQGVPTEIDPDQYANLSQLLDDVFAKYGPRPAFVNRGTVLSYEAVEADSATLAAYLQSTADLSTGDRVAIMMPNLLQTPIAVIAALRAGCVVVNVNPLYTPRELQHQLEDSGAKAIIVLENFLSTVAEVHERARPEHIIVTSAGDCHPTIKRWLINFVVRRVKRLVPKVEIPGVTRWRRAMASGRRSTFEKPAIDPNQDAFLQYTGGTTGVSKGAQLTHRNVASNVLQIATWADPFFDPADGVVVTPLPLYHIFALTVNLFGFALLGGQNLLITDPRDIRLLIAELARHPFTCMTGVNTLFNALLQTSEFANLDFSRFRFCVAGGMAVQRDVAERWQAVTGIAIAQGYGLTEASPVVSASPFDADSFNAAVGVPLPSTDVEIRDDDGHRVATNEIGEICVKGPQVMKGYWQRPNETEQVFYPGAWLRTGDLGRFDADGYLYIEDRIKDVIVVSGFKIYPNEVEDVIMTHAGVLEVAVIGVPDADSGEAVMACVVKKDAALDKATLISHCRERLTGYKIPKFVEFLPELPKSNVGKVLRRELRDRFFGR